MRGTIFSWGRINDCQLDCRLDLDRLFLTSRERDIFESKWPVFYGSDPVHSRLFDRSGEVLSYRSEEIIPVAPDRRPSLLLIFGNPAGHSVDAGLFFSFEANGREHRFWKHILPQLRDDSGGTPAERNARRRERLLGLDYDLPYRLGFSVFFTLPSPASGKWSGVSGVKKLLGVEAFGRLAAAERARVLETAQAFMPGGGTAAVFQKDAWNGLRADQDPAYEAAKARSGELAGSLSHAPAILLFGLPPTRLLAPCRSGLERVMRQGSPGPIS